MSGIALLIIGLGSLALIIGMLAWLGVKAWRLAQHGARVAGRVAPLSAQLASRTDEAGRAATRLAANGEIIQANLARLQESLTRLQILAAALQQALHPYRKIGEYLGR